MRRAAKLTAPRALEIAFAVALGAVAVYYVYRGAATLSDLGSVTDRWIERSGDADFRHDRGMFVFWIGAGAAALCALGVATTIAAWRTVQGRYPYRAWFGLALAAPALHVPWLVYRAIGTSGPTLPGTPNPVQPVGIRFLLICVAYFCMWALTRFSDDAVIADTGIPASRG